MALVPAKCTNCGGDLQIDNTKDAAVCPYCGGAFIIEKGIKLYNQSCTIHGDTVNIYQSNTEHETADALYKTAIKALENKNYSLAEKCLQDIKKYYPSDYRGPLGMIQYRLKSEDMFWLQYIDTEYKDACTLANSDAQKEEIEKAYNVAVEKYKELKKKAKAREDSERQKKIDEQTQIAQKELERIEGNIVKYIIGLLIVGAFLVLSLLLHWKIVIFVLLWPFITLLGCIFSEFKKKEAATIHYNRCKNGDEQRLQEYWERH